MVAEKGPVIAAPFVCPCFVQIELRLRTGLAESRQQLRQKRLVAVHPTAEMAGLLGDDHVPRLHGKGFRQRDHPSVKMAVLLTLIVGLAGKQVLVMYFQRAAADIQVGHFQIESLRLRRLVKKGTGVLRKAVSHGQQFHFRFLLFLL